MKKSHIKTESPHRRAEYPTTSPLGPKPVIQLETNRECAIRGTRAFLEFQPRPLIVLVPLTCSTITGTSGRTSGLSSSSTWPLGCPAARPYDCDVGDANYDALLSPLLSEKFQK
ncbi:hypothetical protein RUM43_011876 [Polyplax serrata]|uniref:Uncharacterized protein n=1 Tax=Polyplax serrata TaxID=468196 RepID=A0AAN8PIT9_POLSC